MNMNEMVMSMIIELQYIMNLHDLFTDDVLDDESYLKRMYDVIIRKPQMINDFSDTWIIVQNIVNTTNSVMLRFKL